MKKRLSPLKFFSIAAGLIAIATCLAIAGWLYFQHWLKTPLNLGPNGYTYELKPGHSLGHLAHELGNNKLMRHPELLKLYARIHQINKIHAGEYFFPNGTTPAALVAKLQAGEVVLYQVTLVEGWTLNQAMAALANNPAVQRELTDTTEAQLLKQLQLPINKLEGWFYPDTYRFSRNTSDVEILQKAHQKMEQVLDAAWQTRKQDLPYKNKYEALIMASIIERETGHHSERDLIAGVFVRRLQQGMKLQTDPTVIYGMGENYNGRITRKNLEEATPYNTYVIDGLPPTPICLPSAASIQAALNPAQGKALYFVARGDGTSEFSETLDEHNRAVKRYQLNRRSDYRAAPAPAEKK